MGTCSLAPFWGSYTWSLKHRTTTSEAPRKVNLALGLQQGDASATLSVEFLTEKFEEHMISESNAALYYFRD